MKKTKNILLITVMFVLSSCSGHSKTGSAQFIDKENNISFLYPINWETRKTENGIIFGSSFSYYDGLSSNSSKDEEEGFLEYQVFPNPDKKSLQSFLDSNYKHCIEKLDQTNGSDPFFGLDCYAKFKRNVSTWEKGEKNSQNTYLSPVEGIPESGMGRKELYVILDNKEKIILLRATFSGVTNEDFIPVTAKESFDSLEIR